MPTTNDTFDAPKKLSWISEMEVTGKLNGAPVSIIPVLLYDEFEKAKPTDGSPVVACCEEEELLFLFQRHCSNLHLYQFNTGRSMLPYNPQKLMLAVPHS